MRIDLVYRQDGVPLLAADAKYRSLTGQGGRSENLYQVIAYCTALGVRTGLLVYAASNTGPANTGSPAATSPSLSTPRPDRRTRRVAPRHPASRRPALTLARTRST